MTLYQKAGMHYFVDLETIQIVKAVICDLLVDLLDPQSLLAHDAVKEPGEVVRRPPDVYIVVANDRRSGLTSKLLVDKLELVGDHMSIHSDRPLVYHLLSVYHWLVGN